MSLKILILTLILISNPASAQFLDKLKDELIKMNEKQKKTVILTS